MCTILCCQKFTYCLNVLLEYSQSKQWLIIWFHSCISARVNNIHDYFNIIILNVLLDCIESFNTESLYYICLHAQIHICIELEFHLKSLWDLAEVQYKYVSLKIRIYVLLSNNKTPRIICCLCTCFLLPITNNHTNIVASSFYSWIIINSNTLFTTHDYCLWSLFCYNIRQLSSGLQVWVDFCSASNVTY